MHISKITNKVATFTVVLLIYWVFGFVCMQVFGFKVFRENITQIFALSIMGILAVLFGAIILNVMYNLTTIADKCRGELTTTQNETKKIKKKIVFFLSSLVLIFTLLFFGDLASSKLKEKRLAAAARILVDEQRDKINKISEYNFSSKYLADTSAAIKLISKIDENFPRVTAIIRDKIENKNVLLGFTEYYYKSKEEHQKVDFILSTSAKERNYLNAIFDGKKDEYLFSSNDGRYEIYFPVKTENGTIVLHLSEYSRYGKFGS